MRIVAQHPASYTLVCDCGREFRARRPVLTFECPACGTAAVATDLLAEWVLDPANHPSEV